MLQKKKCRTCGKIKTLRAYYKNANRPSYSLDCVLCHKLKAAENFRKKYESNSKIRENHIAKVRRNQYKTNPDQRHGYHLKKNYNMTLEDYNKLLDSQNGVCAICMQGESVKSHHNDNLKRLAVDHSHGSHNKIRGLLCSRCNLILGLMKEDSNLFKKMIEYLEIHK